MLLFESKGMLKDCIYGIIEMIFYDLYYQCYVVGLFEVMYVEGDCIEVQVNYVVFCIKFDELLMVFNVGCYIDIIVCIEMGLKLKLCICVFDSEMIFNLIIYLI